MSDQLARKVLQSVTDAELGLLESAARAQAQGRELTPDEAAAAEAYISAFARELASAGGGESMQEQNRIMHKTHSQTIDLSAA